MKTKAAVVRACGEPFPIDDREVPAYCQGEVPVTIAASGVWHTTLHAADGDWPLKSNGVIKNGTTEMDTVAADSGTISLLSGSTIRYRPISASDREALQRFHGRHSDASLYLRFFHLQRELSEVQAQHFTELDGVNRFALVALDPDDAAEIIGVARFDREPGTERAEYAAIIADAWQGHGLGLQLTKRLIEAAKRRGITVFYAFVLPQNLRMLNLLRDLGLPESITVEDDVERIDIDLLARKHSV